MVGNRSRSIRVYLFIRVSRFIVGTRLKKQHQFQVAWKFVCSSRASRYRSIVIIIVHVASIRAYTIPATLNFKSVYPFKLANRSTAQDKILIAATWSQLIVNHRTSYDLRRIWRWWDFRKMFSGSFEVFFKNV